MNAFERRYAIAAEKRKKHYALEAQVARETVMRMFEKAYEEYYGKIPKVTYKRGTFIVKDYGTFSRNKLRVRAEYLSRLRHEEALLKEVSDP